MHGRPETSEASPSHVLGGPGSEYPTSSFASLVVGAWGKNAPEPSRFDSLARVLPTVGEAPCRRATAIHAGVLRIAAGSRIARSSANPAPSALTPTLLRSFLEIASGWSCTCFSGTVVATGTHHNKPGPCAAVGCACLRCRDSPQTGPRVAVPSSHRVTPRRNGVAHLQRINKHRGANARASARLGGPASHVAGE